MRQGDDGGSQKVSPSPLDEDLTCEHLASAHSASVVLASGAFECFASTTHNWELPVYVRAVGTGGGDAAKRVAFVGKPFLPEAMSLRTKNKLFYKVRRLIAKRASWGRAECMLTRLVRAPCTLQSALRRLLVLRSEDASDEPVRSQLHRICIWFRI